MDSTEDKLKQIQNDVAELVEEHEDVVPQQLDATPAKPRITSFAQFTHQDFIDKATGLTLGGTYECETNEQVFKRRIVVNETWQPIPNGWIEPHDASFFILENLEGEKLQVNPTEEERQEIFDSEVWIASEEGDTWEVVPKSHWRVLPGWPFIGLASDISQIKLRCKSGSANCTVHVFPR